VLDRLALPTLGERLLRPGERLLEHHDDEVVDDIGPGPGRTLSVVLGCRRTISFEIIARRSPNAF
jgi:hypothetical protein